VGKLFLNSLNEIVFFFRK